jgi:hypothetical protein
VRPRQHGVPREERAAQAEADVGGEHDPPAVHPVREGAADERGGEQRHQLRRAQQPDGERRLRQPVHLVGQGHVRDHAAQVGDELRGEEPPEVAMA